MRILAFGTYDVDAHPRVGALLQGFRDNGHEVVEVNVPLGLDTAQRIALVRRPWRLPLFALRLLRCWARLVRCASAERRRRRPDAILVGYLGHFDVHLARRLFPRTPIVLDHLVSAAGTTQDRGLASGAGAATRVLRVVMRRIDAAALAAADVVLVDTEQRRAALPAETAIRTAVCPVGATDPWFAAGAAGLERPAGTPLRLVFVGLYTPLHGTPVLAEALAALSDDDRIEITMVGAGQDRPQAQRIARANRRITWLDWVPGAELPALVAGHDVSLGIFGTTPKASEVVPTKVYQGAAAATVVLTSDTSPQRAALEDDAVLVPPGDAEALTSAIRRLADDPDLVDRLRRSAYDRALDHFTAGAAVLPALEALTTLGLLDQAQQADRHLPSTRPDSNAVPLRGEPVTDIRRPAMPGSRSRRLPPLAPRAHLRYQVVARLLDRLRPGTVLEIGAGQGAFGARLSERYDYLGVEPDDTSYEIARAAVEPRGGRLLHGIHTVVPAGSSYDLVCAFEVLEHLEDDAGALADWIQLVRPGGHLLLSVPAFQERFGPMDTQAGHFRRYSPGELSGLLQAAGFDDVDVTVYGWPLGYALEIVRNRVAARKLQEADQEASMAELTGASGRILQPRAAWQGALVAAATTPFGWLQRLRPTAGTGLVALARRARVAD